MWFAPPRSRPEAPPVEPAIWTGPENPHTGNPKLTREMIAEIRVLRAEGWSTGKLAKRYGVKRATICYALLGRTFREGPRRPLLSPPRSRPHLLPPSPAKARRSSWLAHRLVERRSIRDRRVRGVGSVPGDGRGGAPTPPEFFGPPLPEPAIWIGPTEFEWEQEFD